MNPLDQIPAYLAAAREAALKLKGALFDGTPATVPILEEILSAIHTEIHRSSFRRKLGLGVNETEIEQWANVWGIYLGEVLRLQLGGKWIVGHEEAPHLLAVELTGGTIAFPTARVFRRLTDGEKENVVEYYQYIAG